MYWREYCLVGRHQTISRNEWTFTVIRQIDLAFDPCWSNSVYLIPHLEHIEDFTRIAGSIESIR